MSDRVIITHVSGNMRVRLVGGELQVLEGPNPGEEKDLKLVVSVPLLPEQAVNLALDLNHFANANNA